MVNLESHVKMFYFHILQKQQIQEMPKKNQLKHAKLQKNGTHKMALKNVWGPDLHLGVK